MNRIILAAVAALSVAAVAAPATAAINARGLNHDRLIDAGVRSGKLTPAEARTLRAEQNAIERQKRRFERDGNYSRREKAIIHDQQDAAGRHIDRLKANNRFVRK